SCSLHGDSARSDGACVTGALSEHATETASRPAGAPPTGPSPAEARPALTTAPPARRLVLLNFDGADLDTILTMQAQGKLPAFSRLVQEGTYGRLASILPRVASVTRATLVTGLLPYRHRARRAPSRRVPAGHPATAVV